MSFELNDNFTPKGDQPKAIKTITEGLEKGEKHQTILGATGTGKTFVMANIIKNIKKPTLILTHNKTLAAQLCAEFREFFPDAAVNYFVSYYDYYQPEAYMPASDTYIAKDASINDEIDKYRHAATMNLLTRDDIIIISTVSCIYGIGSKDAYSNASFTIELGQTINRQDILKQLTELQYHRNDLQFDRGRFRVRGDVIEIYPPYSDFSYRIELFGDEVDSITETDPLTSEMYQELKKVMFFPAKHAVTSPEKIDEIIPLIKDEMKARTQELESQDRRIEAQRIVERVNYDMEILKETGYVSGIENYSRYISGNPPGHPPNTLLDYFPEDFILFVDESHISIPQIGGMFAGDYSRKKTLVEHGFRLPSAYDNRPLKDDEFWSRINKAVYVSATPRERELGLSPEPTELINRPTGLLDPIIEVRPTKNQIDNLTKEINETIKKGQRTLITTLTKKMAEELSEYYTEAGYKVSYLHSEIGNMERIQILSDLRRGVYDILIGINLLREGLDLPEVSFVAILDADKEGFLRSASALIQTIGRAARNAEGRVIMYADNETDSMKKAIGETARRREIQIAYNKEHGITPKTIIKEIKDIAGDAQKVEQSHDINLTTIPKEDIPTLIAKLEIEMDECVANLEFEKAADLRDEIEKLMKL